MTYMTHTAHSALFPQPQALLSLYHALCTTGRAALRFRNRVRAELHGERMIDPTYPE